MWCISKHVQNVRKKKKMDKNINTKNKINSYNFMILETWRSLLGRWTREVFDKDPKMTYLNLLRFNCKVCSRMISYNQFRGLQFHL